MSDDQVSNEKTVTASGEQNDQPSSNKAYDQVKADMLKYKMELKKTNEEKERLLEEKKSLETKSLQEQNQYKTLYEKTVEENKLLKDSVSKMKVNFMENEKLREIESKALAVGLKPKALDLLRTIAHGTDDVIVEVTNTGRTQVVGTDMYIEKLKQQYGDVLFVDGRAPAINTNLPNGNVTPKTWTPKEILDLQKKDPAQYTKIMQERINKRSQ